MSSVLLQVGQCGNQIGQQFWNTVIKDDFCQECHVYQCGDGFLRSVNVDSEPKVVRQLVRDGKGRFRERNTIIGRRGCGTNWALGYHGNVKRGSGKDVLLETTMEALRKEIERCDNFSGVIMMHSIAGGTGSGLGSRLCETIRELYPMNYILSCVVAPHVSGESPLQHYNSLLCLASLQKHSDCIALFHNDEVLYRMQKRARGEERGVSFSKMNTHIASCIAGICLPVSTVTPQSGVSIGSEPWDMIRSISPMPATKFVHINNIARSKLTWENLTGLLIQSNKRRDLQGKSFTSLGNLVVARGDPTGAVGGHITQIEKRVEHGYNTVGWNPFPVELWSGRTNVIGSNDCSSVTIAANYSSIGENVEQILDRAWLKYSAKAYLHWYEKYGCQKDDFEDAFNCMQNVVEEYQDAVS